jgi:Flp pilus assembly protein TadB
MLRFISEIIKLYWISFYLFFAAAITIVLGLVLSTTFKAIIHNYIEDAKTRKTKDQLIQDKKELTAKSNYLTVVLTIIISSYIFGLSLISLEFVTLIPPVVTIFVAGKAIGFAWNLTKERFRRVQKAFQ